MHSPNGEFVMTEFTPAIGIGVGELAQAALEESRRIMRSAKGDRRQAGKLLLNKVRELGWITEAEQKSIQQLLDLAATDGSGKKSTTAAYFEARKVHHAMLAEGKAGPVALALASGAVGAFEPVETPKGVIYKTNNRSYQAVLGSAGAIIGGALGGGPGAAIGGAIGGVIGTIVDDCND
jgi:hypothetical protein